MTQTIKPTILQAPTSWLPAQGVFPDSLLRRAIDSGWVTGADGEIPTANIQPASLDIRLANVAYRLRSSFLPGRRPVMKSLGEYQLGPPIPLTGGAVLERGRPYLIPLLESLDLPPGVSARANPKSSIGRLDVFTRIVVDRSPGFDEIPDGYAGPMYLEVVSRSFTIQVTEGLTLSQLRLVHGNKEVADVELSRIHARTPLLYQYNLESKKPYLVDELVVSNGLFLTVDLSGATEIGYRAKKNSMLLDLSKIGGYRIEDFWEQVKSDQRRRLILEPEEFYLLVSLEGVAIPPEYAGEMTAYDPTSGELRTHYAGFFDPGFGFSQLDGVHGSRAVLEVRAHDVPFALEHGQKIARLELEPMIKPPNKPYGPAIGSSYQNQSLKLSKLFRDPVPKNARQAKLIPDMME